MQFSIDSDLIWRVFAAFLWGLGFACWLRLTREGQKFERRYTAVATSIGIAVDLFLAFGLDWAGVAAVIVASGIGPVGFGLSMGYPADENYHRNKIKWAIEDTTALLIDLVDRLTGLLREGDLPAEALARVSEILAMTHQAKRIITDAQRGEYDGGK